MIVEMMSIPTSLDRDYRELARFTSHFSKDGHPSSITMAYELDHQFYVATLSSPGSKPARSKLLKCKDGMTAINEAMRRAGWQ